MIKYGIPIAVLLSVSSCIGVLPPTLTRYSVVEITDATGKAVTDADVRVARLETGDLAPRWPSGTSVLEPPDHAGLLRVPVTYRSNAVMSVDDVPPFDGTLRFTIAALEGTEVLDVANEVDATTHGSMFTVRVVSVRADPPLTEPCVDLDVEPPVVRINGYLRDLRYCGPGDGSDFWVQAEADHSYVECVTIGEVPDGFSGRSSDCAEVDETLASPVSARMTTVNEARFTVPTCDQ